MDKKIKLSNIYLDSDNPRLLQEGVNENEIILNLIEDKKDRNKILNLMESIAKQGLSPLDKIAVLEEEENVYTVKEGNRRILALKLFQNPEIVKEKYENFYNKIKILKPLEQILIINCEILNQEELSYWIKLKHTGENKGAGVVKWDTLGIKKFQEQESGEKHDIQEIIEIFKNKSKMNNVIKNKIKNLKGSLLERLMSDPDIRKELGVKKEEKKLIIEELNKEFLDKMFYDLLINQTTSKKIRYKKDRENYILDVYNIEVPKKYYLNEPLKGNKKLIEEIYKKDLIKEPLKIDHVPKEILEKNNIQLFKVEEEKELKKVREKENQHTNDRKTLIPKNLILKIEKQKINNLYIELKKCNVDDYIAIISSSFRVFLELTLDYYMSNNKHLEQKRSNLIEKFGKVIKDLENNHLINEGERKNLELAANGDKSFMSIKSLNALIHTPLGVTSTDLKLTWDNYQILFEKIYKNN